MFQATRDIQHSHSILANLQYDFNQLNQQIQQDARPSFGEAVLIQAYHPQTTTADVEVSFWLREHNPADTISVTARGQAGSHNANAVATGGGHFTAQMSLPLQDNYTFTFTASGETATSGELMQLDLAGRLYNRFIFHVNHGTTSGPNLPTVVSLHPHFRNTTQGDPALDIASIVMYVETEDGDVITTWDLTNYLQSTHDGQMLNLHWEQELSLTVGEEGGNIRPGTHMFTRLEIRDNLGILYRQIDVLGFAGQFGAWGGSSVAAAPMPIYARDFHGHGMHNWGRMQIVK